MTLDDLVRANLAQRKQPGQLFPNRSASGFKMSTRIRLAFSLFRRMPESAVFCIQTKNKPLQTYGALSNSRAP